MKKKKFKPIVIDFKKYWGKEVAIVDGKVVTSGKNSKEVLKKAKKTFS